MRGSRRGQRIRTPPPQQKKRITKIQVSLALLVGVPRKKQASIQWLAIISPPGKRHVKAFRWRANDDPLLVVL